MDCAMPMAGESEVVRGCGAVVVNFFSFADGSTPGVAGPAVCVRGCRKLPELLDRHRQELMKFGSLGSIDCSGES